MHRTAARKGLLRPLPPMDLPFLVLVLTLVAFGLVMLCSASSAVALYRRQDAFAYVRPQLLYAAMGLGAMWMASRVDYHIYHKLAWPLLALSLVLLTAVLFMPEYNGCKRWLVLPGLGTLQPSEIAKFAVVLVFAYHFQTQCPYAYGYGPIKTPVLNETQIADNMIDENFTKSNLVALVVPKNDDYRVEAAMIKELESHDEVDHTRGLSNIEAMDGYMLEDRLTSRQFSEMAGLDYELAQVVYTGYALENDEYGQVIGNFSNYSVPLIDMFLYVCDEVDSGIVSLDQDQINDLHDAQTQMLSAKAQLQGADYNRILVYLNPSLQSGDEMYEFTDQMRTIARKYYPDGDIYLAGDATNEYDFQKSFAIDNIVVSVVSVLIVLIVLLFTFQSVAMPILLILVIEGAIWVNFSVPAFIHTPLYFMGYLIVSSIQMGANIDYAIVIATRYNELRDKMDHKTAMIETLNFAFPTILTSGTIMTVAGTLIGQMTSDACIVGIGQCLGRGTIISIFLVLFVLPQILLVGGKLVDKTSFSMHHVVLHTNTASGRVRVNGMVQGEVNGSVAGTMNAVVDGNVHLTVLSGKISQEVQDENDSHADE